MTILINAAIMFIGVLIAGILSARSTTKFSDRKIALLKDRINFLQSRVGKLQAEIHTCTQRQRGQDLRLVRTGETFPAGPKAWRANIAAVDKLDEIC